MAEVSPGKSIGLKTEILMTLTLLFGAAFVLGGFMVLQLTEKSLLQERVRQLRSVSQILGGAVVQQASAGNRSELNPVVLRQLPEQLDCLGWRMLDGDGTPVAATEGHGQLSLFSSSQLSLARFSGEVQQNIYYTTLPNWFGDSENLVAFLIPLAANGRSAWLLELSFSLDGIREQLARHQKIVILYTILYGVVLIAAGYFLLHKNVIRPAKNLLAATDAVSRGALDSRLPTAGPAEIGQLASAFNRMVKALRSSREETQKHIAQVERTNRQLQEARDEVVRSEKLASVGQLAAGLAHELGNPLAALIGYLELLKQNTTNSSARDMIERSLSETQRIDFLVRELLDFSRPDAGCVQESVDPVSELRATVELISNQGGLGHVQLVDQLPERINNIKINRQKLQQVFINLLLNAVQACEEPGRITLTGGERGGQVWIAVEDDGCGISPEHQARLFDPFFTTKAPGEGTGLGLAICQRIVAEAEGKIKVESRVGEGSVFLLQFDLDYA